MKTAGRGCGLRAVNGGTVGRREGGGWRCYNGLDNGSGSQEGGRQTATGAH